MTTPAWMSPSGRSGHPRDRAGRVAEQAGHRRGRQQVEPRRPRPSRPASGRSRGGSGRPVGRRAAPGLAAEVDGEGLRLRQHHRRAAGDLPLIRRVLPPLRVQPVEDAAGRRRRRTCFLLPAKGPRSSRARTVRPGPAPSPRRSPPGRHRQRRRRSRLQPPSARPPLQLVDDPLASATTRGRPSASSGSAGRCSRSRRTGVPSPAVAARRR